MGEPWKSKWEEVETNYSEFYINWQKLKVCSFESYGLKNEFGW